jgi:armadillo repeat-containing protein 6
MAAFKRIQQGTFDDVVKENVEDFEMSLKEALKDAISQFETQGVDLTSIDLTGGVGREEVETAVKHT